MVERFLGFVGTAVTDAETLSKYLFLFMDGLELNYARFLVGQCYDGAASMSGWLTGLNMRIRAIALMALFVHCYAHQLNLYLVAGCAFFLFFFKFNDV